MHDAMRCHAASMSIFHSLSLSSPSHSPQKYLFTLLLVRVKVRELAKCSCSHALSQSCTHFLQVNTQTDRAIVVIELTMTEEKVD